MKHLKMVLLGVLSFLSAHVGCCVILPIFLASASAAAGAKFDFWPTLWASITSLAFFYLISVYQKKRACEDHKGHQKHFHIFCSEFKILTFFFTMVVSMMIGVFFHWIFG